jgi:hypothetical protein
MNIVYDRIFCDLHADDTIYTPYNYHIYTVYMYVSGQPYAFDSSQYNS